MTAPQATPACAIGLPGSFTGVSELEVLHAVAGPIAARNDLARCGPLQRQRLSTPKSTAFWISHCNCYFCDYERRIR
jgi:hypothetical protein